jgi:adenylate cyclase
MESLAEGGGICISGTVHDHVENKLDLDFEYVSEQVVKNIVKPIRVYRVRMEGAMERIKLRSASLPEVIGEVESKAEGSSSVKVESGPVAVSSGRKGWVIGVIVLIVVLSGLGWGLVRFLESRRAEEKKGEVVKEAPVKADVKPASGVEVLDKLRIVVLPVVNIGNNPENEYFSDGMTEELISQLSKVRELSVIARTSAMAYKNTTKKVDEIGRELKVGTVLEASVRRFESRIRVTVQLIDVASQVHVMISYRVALLLFLLRSRSKDFNFRKINPISCFPQIILLLHIQPKLWRSTKSLS